MDGINDNYSRGFFIDHIFTDWQFEKYISGDVAGDGVFSKVIYDEEKLSLSRREVILKAHAVCGTQKISLTKKYIINSSGMNIQYIIHNDSDTVFKSKFCVESNFSIPGFTTQDTNPFKVLLATETEALEVDSQKSSKECLKKGYLSNINVVQISDLNDSISFSFEPNENCSYCFYPLMYNRPKDMFCSNGLSRTALVSTLFWDLDIEPGKETEKNFNFTIYATHKQKKRK